MFQYKINDPIHGIIAFNEKEKAVIDHPYFQRLRYIKQLSFVNFVFPGATHDRFSHSLGAMHVAFLLSHQLLYNEIYSVLARVLSEKEKKFVSDTMRLAGLLHDIGHAPFSHAAEDNMPPLKTLAIPRTWFAKTSFDRRAKHEDYSVFVIYALSQGAHPVLSQEESEIIASLIHKEIAIPKSWDRYFSSRVNVKSLHALVRSWISGDVDVDRMDYLLRDSYFTGVPYGNYDLSWLITNLGVIEKNGNYVTSISEAGVHAFEYYLLARYNMFTQVYFHKTVRCFEHYFKEALLKNEISYIIPSDLSDYVALRDTTLIEPLFAHAKRNPSSWSSKLMRREAAKRIARVWGGYERATALFRTLKKELASMHIPAFVVFSQSKFLDYEESISSKKEEKTSSLFSALSMTPLMVIRRQFGVRTALSMEDFSFILKHYHQDISIGDIFIPRDKYRGNENEIRRVLANYLEKAPSEIVLEEEG